MSIKIIPDASDIANELTFLNMGCAITDASKLNSNVKDMKTIMETLLKNKWRGSVHHKKMEISDTKVKLTEPWLMRY